MPIDTKSRALDGVLAVGVIIVTVTEGLSLVRGLNRFTVSLVWAVVAAVFLAGRPWRRWSWPVVDARVATILGVTAIIAIVSPPNGWDPMSYHMSRIVYWMQNGSVEHFPTHSLRQVIYSPFAEFCLLHLQLLSGGDRFANLVQWAAFAESLAAVAALARRCGGGPAAVGAAVVFAATLPMAILQSTGTENDMVLALWLLVGVLAVEEHLRTGTTISALKVGAAAGLMALTKGTAYILGAPLLIGWGVLLLARSASRSRAVARLGCAAALALALNAGHYWRNYTVFGHPLGERTFIDYQKTQIRSLPVLVSNIVRNVSLHLPTPIPSINNSIVLAVTALHSRLGLDPRDERITILRTPFSIGMSLQQDKTGNPLHFVAIVVVLGTVALRRLTLPRLALAVLGVALTGFVLLSWLLKWQPWESRYHLCLFMVMAVPCGVAATQTLSPRVLRWLSAALVVAALPWLLANEDRTLISLGPSREHNILLSSREALYMAFPLDQILETAGWTPRRWDMVTSYRGAVEMLRRSGCRDVGVIQATDSWDYPLWAMARLRGFKLRMWQIQVENATAALPSRRRRALCAVVTIDSPLGFSLPKPDPRVEGPEIYRAAPVTISLITAKP